MSTAGRRCPAGSPGWPAASAGGPRRVHPDRPASDVVVHAGIEAALPVLTERVCGHGQDRHGGSRAGADRARGLQAVHDRHLHVHQDRVIAALANLLQGFGAVVGEIGVEADALQQLQRDFLVDRVVFDDQQPDMCSTTGEQLGVGCGCCRVRRPDRGALTWRRWTRARNQKVLP